MPPPHNTGCQHYSDVATEYAKTWMQYADAKDHYKISYNFNSSTWSIK